MGQGSPDRVYRIAVTKRTNVRVTLEPQGFRGVLSLRRVCSDDATEVKCAEASDDSRAGTDQRGSRPRDLLRGGGRRREPGRGRVYPAGGGGALTPPPLPASCAPPPEERSPWEITVLL